MVVLWLLACGGSDPAPPTSETTPSTLTTPPTTSPGPTTPTTPTPTTAPTGDTGAPPPAVDCAALGLPVRAWQGDGQGWAPEALAGDVVASTTRGPFVLSEVWQGCEDVLILPDTFAQEGTDPWTEGAVKRLVDDLPPHTLLLVGALDGDPSFVAEAEGWLAAAGIVDRAWVIDEPLTGLDGWLGAAMRGSPFGFGVDRQQQVRYVGSLAYVDDYNAAIGWWDGRLEMAAHEVLYWDFLHDRQLDLDARPAEVVDLWQGEVLEDPGWAGVRGTVTVDLPADLSGYDTLEADLALGCGGVGEVGYCPAWDYLVYLYVCAEGETTCSTELGRWITTYHREGRWVHDLTPLLPLLDGGPTTFQFYTQQPYEVDLSLRLSTEGGERPVGAVPLFRGGDLVAGFNESIVPIQVDVPATATRVELATVISGHGQTGLLNCAEFCEIENRFFVGGDVVEISYPIAGTDRGCEDDVPNGTVPNQYGTWWFGRNGWCPGKEVPVARHDVTALVTPGQPVEVGFEALRNGVSIDLPGARTEVESWLVFYE